MSTTQVVLFLKVRTINRESDASIVQTENGFNASVLHQRLHTQLVGKRIYHYSHLTSTMDRARELAIEGVEEGAVVIAESQGGGRGRFGRVWLSPPGGNVYLSVILYPSRAVLRKLVVASSLAVCHALERVAGLHCGIKWPNDILVNGQKASGILIESSSLEDRVQYAIAGIGINVTADLRYNKNLIMPATCVEAEAGGRVSRIELVAVLLEEIDLLYGMVKRDVDLIEEWSGLLVNIGRKVALQQGDRRLEGIARGVDSEGSLLLQTDDGRVHALTSGEVTLH